MLTYAYECDACGTFEARQSITDARLERCPECGGAVRRLLSGGSGFVMKKKGGSAAPPPRMAGCSQAESCPCPCAAASARA